MSFQETAGALVRPSAEKVAIGDVQIGRVEQKGVGRDPTSQLEMMSAQFNKVAAHISPQAGQTVGQDPHLLAGSARAGRHHGGLGGAEQHPLATDLAFLNHQPLGPRQSAGLGIARVVDHLA